MNNDTVTPPPGPLCARTRTNRVVCTACRQAKVRCIGSEDGNCSRCTRIGLDCLRDSNFKRVSKSRKIAELEKQVQLLATAFNGSAKAPQPAAVQQHQSSPTSLNQQSPLPVGQSCAVPALLSQISAPAPAQSGFLNPAATPNSRYPASSSSRDSGTLQNPFHVHGAPPPRPGGASPRSIHAAYITGTEIDDLFREFFEIYHPAIPFLNPFKSPDDYYNSGSILFWMIVSVASRRYTNDMLLFPVLCEWVPKMLWEAIATPPYTIPLVQALVLACTWPFPTSTTWADTLMTMSSIMVSAGMQLGLHRPLNATDFLRQKATADENDYHIRVSTWAAVNIASHSCESLWGVLPTTPFDISIERGARSGTIYSLPDSLRFKVAIFRYCNRISNLVVRDLTDTGDPFSPFSPSSPPANPTLSWVQELEGFEEKMLKFQGKYRDQLSLHDQIYIAAAEVYTNSMYFFDSTTSSTRKINILKCYTSVTKYINLLLTSDSTHDYLRYGPIYTLRMFYISCCVLVKVLRSSYATDVDFEAGKRLCNSAIVASSRASTANQDTPKIAKMVSQVWHSSDQSTLEEPPTLMVKSRLGASILYDFIWTWRQEFGGQPDAYSKPNSSLTPQPFDDIMSFTNGVFDDASMVDLEFMNDPDWMDSITNSIFTEQDSGTTTQAADKQW